MKYFVYIIISIVAASIVAGFFIIGSPQEERLRRFDEQRVGDLQFLQSYIVQYWQNKGKLPENLKVLHDDLRGVIIPLDPESRKEYIYEVRGSLTFALCAEFSRPSLGRETLKSAPAPAYPVGPYGGIGGGESWEHGEGRVCFERTIDPDFFKPIKPPELNRPL